MSSFKLDDDVRRLRGGPITGGAVLSWVSVRALRILIFRKAFFHNCLPMVVVGSMVGVAEKLNEDSSLTGEFRGVGGTRGDVGVKGSLITAVASDN